MNSEERFKKELDDILSSKEFSFDEANWEKAKEMIDASKKRKNRLVPLLAASVIILLTAGLSYYFLSGDQTSAPSDLALNDKSEINTSPSPAETQTIPQNQTVNIPVTSPAAEKTSVKTKSPGTNEVSPVKNTASVSDPLPEETFAAPTSNETEAGKVSVRIKQKIKPVKGSAPSTLAETKITPLPVEIPSANGGNNSEDQAPVISKQEAPAVISPDEKTAEPATAPAKEDQNEIPASIANQDNTKNETQVIPVTTQIETKTNETPELSQAPVEKTVAPVVPPAENNAILPDSLRPEPALLFSFEAGASYLIGWNNPGNRDANGINPVVGINYFNQFSEKIMVSFGIQYNTVRNLEYSTRSAKVTRLNFGEESKVTEFTPVKLYYVTAPIRINYALDAKNTVGIGCNLSYLLNVESSIKTYDQKLNSTSAPRTVKTTGYTEGFKPFETQLSAFYKRKLYKNIWLNAELFYGLTDIKEDSFFDSNVFERNTGLKLTLVYNIFKK